MFLNMFSMMMWTMVDWFSGTLGLNMLYVSHLCITSNYCSTHQTRYNSTGPVLACNTTCTAGAFPREGYKIMMMMRNLQEPPGDLVVSSVVVGGGGRVWHQMTTHCLKQLERLHFETTPPPPPPPPPPPHDYPYYWFISDPKSKQDKVKVTNLKNSSKIQILEFCKKIHTQHTFWISLIRNGSS